MPPHYKIASNNPYIFSEFKLNSNESIDLFYQLKKDIEYIFYGKVDNLLLFRYNFLSDITAYLKEKKFLQPLHQSSSNERQFAKCCWLADSIIDNGIIDPVSIHYNPRMQQHIVHPGQSRIYISQLFRPEAINCLYFNTSGVRFSWMKKFVTVNKESLIEMHPSYVTVSADHGSIIPHIYFGNQPNTLNSVLKYHDMIKHRLSDKNFQIKSNIKIDPLEHWLTDSDTAPIEITIKTKKFSDDDVVRACILAVLGRPWTSDTLEVKINQYITNPFSKFC
jgi:hypothetical protein